MGDSEMKILDFVAVHTLCARVANEGLDPTTIFAPVDSEGYRTSIFGGCIKDVDHDKFIQRCAVTLQAVGLKRQIVAAWKKENGQW